MSLPQNHSITRRDFLKQTTQVGVFCGFTCLCPHFSNAETPKDSIKIPNLKALNYCGHQCPKDCPTKLAGQSDDLAFKKEVYVKWRIWERYQIPFKAETIFCNGCKTEESLGVAVENCPVRKCAVKKGLESCIQCKTLPHCEQKLWAEFPGFHDHVIQIQKTYETTLSRNG